MTVVLRTGCTEALQRVTKSSLHTRIGAALGNSTANSVLIFSGQRGQALCTNRHCLCKRHEPSSRCTPHKLHGHGSATTHRAVHAASGLHHNLLLRAGPDQAAYGFTQAGDTLCPSACWPCIAQTSCRSLFKARGVHAEALRQAHGSSQPMRGSPVLPARGEEAVPAVPVPVPTRSLHQPSQGSTQPRRAAAGASALFQAIRDPG